MSLNQKITDRDLLFGSDEKRLRMKEHYQSEMDISDEHNKWYGKKYQVKGRIMPPRRSTEGAHANVAAGSEGMVKVKEDFPFLPEEEDFKDDDSQREGVMNQVHDLYPWRSFNRSTPVQPNAQDSNATTFGAEVQLAPIKSGMESYRTNMSAFRIDASTAPNAANYVAAQLLGGQSPPLASLNFGGSSPVKQPANPGPAVIEEKARNYDESTDLPNKSQHAPMFESEMHPDFVAYAKAVIFDIWDQVKGTVTLNSTFRSVGKQRRMRAKWDAWKAGTGPNPNYAARPAKAGYSKHNLGTAIDFNVTIGGKAYGRRSASKADWVSSGVPDIITSNGLVWGGVWNNYDPIHMHLDVSEDVRKAIIDASGQYEDGEAAIAALSSVAIAPGTDNSNIEKPVSDSEGGPV